MAEGRAADAAALLEKDREPARADVELGLGRAYAATGETAKAAAASPQRLLQNAAQSGSRYRQRRTEKLSGLPPVPFRGSKDAGRLARQGQALRGCGQRIPRFARMKSRSRIVPSVELALASALQKSGRNKDAKQILACVSRFA